MFSSFGVIFVYPGCEATRLHLLVMERPKRKAAVSLRYIQNALKMIQTLFSTLLLCVCMFSTLIFSVAVLIMQEYLACFKTQSKTKKHNLNEHQLYCLDQENG